MNITSYSTNKSSMIVQSNLQKSSNALNTAIERMTTGFKINHAKDNAANYSISNKMSSQISAYQIAEDNTSMGLDMVQTAGAALEEINNLTNRIRNLAEQAQNGVYGSESLEAINSEARSLMSEINRIKANAEYNGIDLLNSSGGTKSKIEYLNSLMSGASGASGASGVGIHNVSGSYTHSGASGASSASSASGASGASGTSGNYYVGTIENSDGNKTFELHDGFINKVEEVSSDVRSLIGYTNAVSLYSNIMNSSSGGTQSCTFGISDRETLISLANMFNYYDNEYFENQTFVLTADIDLTGVDWVSIGNSSSDHTFNATFDGQGHKITGLSGDKGLFGTIGESGVVKNLAVEGAEIDRSGARSGILAHENRGTIFNCYTTGSIKDSSEVGGLVGDNRGDIICSYSRADVESSGNPDALTGGLVGSSISGNISSCFATGDVKCSQNGMYVGGLVGQGHSVYIDNCYATGDVTTNGSSYVGGLIGMLEGNSISNCYATGNVVGCQQVGGLVGDAVGDIGFSYATGNVTGDFEVGGLAGVANYNISDSFSIGDVEGALRVGGLVGETNGASFGIYHAYTLSKVTGSGSISGAVIGYNGSASLGIQGGYDSSINPNLDGFGYKSVNVTSDISLIHVPNSSIRLQVGINGDESSAIEFDLKYPETSIESVVSGGLEKSGVLEAIDNFLSEINLAQTSYGAVENRLMSAMESIGVAYENLVSSRSTIKDADIAQVSSDYIRHQILQQASATLLATANQAPSIALQLI